MFLPDILLKTEKKTFERHLQKGASLFLHNLACFSQQGPLVDLLHRLKSVQCVFLGSVLYSLIYNIYSFLPFLFRNSATLRPCYTKQFFLQLATQRWRIKSLSSCRRGVTRLQRFSQLATRTITNKMADTVSRRHLAHSDKITLQVTGGMLRASNLSRNVAKSRRSFYFSCNSQRNNCSCKNGVLHVNFPLKLATQRVRKESQFLP